MLSGTVMLNQDSKSCFLLGMTNLEVHTALGERSLVYLIIMAKVMMVHFSVNMS